MLSLTQDYYIAGKINEEVFFVNISIIENSKLVSFKIEIKKYEVCASFYHVVLVTNIQTCQGFLKVPLRR